MATFRRNRAAVTPATIAQPNVSTQSKVAKVLLDPQKDKVWDSGAKECVDAYNGGIEGQQSRYLTVVTLGRKMGLPVIYKLPADLKSGKKGQFGTWDFKVFSTLPDPYQPDYKGNQRRPTDATISKARSINGSLLRYSAVFDGTIQEAIADTVAVTRKGTGVSVDGVWGYAISAVSKCLAAAKEAGRAPETVPVSEIQEAVLKGLEAQRDKVDNKVELSREEQQAAAIKKALEAYGKAISTLETEGVLIAKDRDSLLKKMQKLYDHWYTTERNAAPDDGDPNGKSDGGANSDAAATDNAAPMIVTPATTKEKPRFPGRALA